MKKRIALNIPLDELFEKTPPLKSVMFNTTYSCNLKCAHCGYSCSPDLSKNFIPKDVVIFYLNQISRNKHFKGFRYIISGGEPTLVYDHDENYLRDIWRAGAKLGLFASLSTNSFVANTVHFKKFIDDVEMFYEHPSAFQINLSGDEFHNNFSENIELITELYTNPKLQGVFSVLSCRTKWMIDSKDKFTGTGLPITSPQKGSIRIGNTWMRTWDNLTDIGGAKKRNLDNKHEWGWGKELFRMTFHNECGHSMHFQNDGRVVLASHFDRSIATDYRDEKGNLKPIGQLRRELHETAVEKLAGTYRMMIDMCRQHLELMGKKR